MAHTKPLLQKHALKENPLRVGRFVSHTDLFIQRTEPGLNEVQCAQAIGGKAYASALPRLDWET